MGSERLIKADHEYRFLAGMPTYLDPYLTFQLVRIDRYLSEKQKRYDTIKQSKPGGLLKLALLPLWLPLKVVSMGDVDIYKSRRRVIDSEKKWERNSGDNGESRKIPIQRAEVILKYKYTGEENRMKLMTDSQGLIRKDLRPMARSIARDPQAEEFVEFTINALPPYNLPPGIIMIKQKVFINIYKKSSEDGEY